MADTTKLSKLLNKTYDNENGNRIRQITRLLIKKYKDKPEELKPYFKDKDQYLAGIASSAYQYITGDFKPIQELEFGGLGAIVKESPKKLGFGKSQLHHAKTSGEALRNSSNGGDALYKSINYGKSLFYSTNSERALRRSTNSGWALFDSINLGESLFYSTNSERALKYSTNSMSALSDSTNSRNTLNHSTNFGDALSDSTNSETSLFRSTNSDGALHHSTNSEDSLKGSTNSGSTLHHSKNYGSTLSHSTNSNMALFHSTNSNMALSDSTNSEHVLFHSTNSENVLSDSTNSNMALSDSTNSGHVLFKSKNSDYVLSNSKNSDYVLEDSTNSETSLFKSKNSDYVLSNSKNFNLATLFSNNSEKTFQNASFDIDLDKFTFIYNNISEENLKYELINSMSKLKHDRFLNQYFDDKISIGELFECSKFEATNEEIIRPLGSGTIGETYLVHSKEFNKEMVLKVGLDDKIFQQEKEQLSKQNHQNIVRVYGTGPVKKNGTPINAILMEYVEGQDLHDIMKKNKQGLESKLAINYSDQLLDGIEHMITQNLEHRDLHLNNILITQDQQLKIIDFGIARTKESNSGDIKYNRIYGGPNDIFSWALLTYKVLTGTHLISKRKKDQPREQYASIISERKEKMRKLDGGLYKKFVNKIESNIPQELQKPLLLALENKNGFNDLNLLNEVRTNFNEGLAINTLDSNILEGYRTISGNQELTHNQAYQMHKIATGNIK